MRKINLQFVHSMIVAGVWILSACDLPPVRTFQVEPKPATENQSDSFKGENNLDNDKQELPRNEKETPRYDQGRAADRVVTGDSSPQNSHSPHWIEIITSADTLLKIQNVDSAALLKYEKCPLPRGTRHSLATAPEWIGSHVKVSLKQPMVGCPFTSGWIFAAHIGAASDDPPTPETKTHNAVATLYTTENTSIEGGPKDRCGRKLNTLDDYMNWKSEEVSVAMDRLALPYGTLIRIPEIEKRLKVSDPIPFRVVDTGGAFVGKGFSRIDICVGHNQDTIFSSKYVWMSHAKFEFQVISLGKSFDCY